MGCKIWVTKNNVLFHMPQVKKVPCYVPQYGRSEWDAQKHIFLSTSIRNSKNWYDRGTWKKHKIFSGT